MKKTIFTLTTILILGSCKKNENTEIDSNSIKLLEMNVEQVSELLSAKQNDTLYVTNFFATWCGPCMREIPHFKEKMNELKNEKIKFTFISIDRKEDWNTQVNDFAIKQELGKNIILFNTENMTGDFFAKNFKTWNGGAIPFTMMKKGDKVDEFVGMIDKQTLSDKINSMK